MVYLTISTIIGAFLILYLISAARERRRKTIEKIRTAWGAPKTDEFNFFRIGRYAAMAGQNDRHTLSQQTLDDIDFHQLFAFIDRTTSKIGQQFLFRRVLHPFNAIADHTRMNALANIMAGDPVLREEIQKELIKLDHPGAYNICNLIDLKVSKRPAWFKFLYVNLILIFVLIVLSVTFPSCLILAIIPGFINTMAHYWHRGAFGSSFSAFAELNNLMNVSRNLLRRSGLDRAEVEDSLRHLKPFRWRVALLNPGKAVMQDDLSQFGFFLNELFNGIFLIEVFTVQSLAEGLEKKSGAISILFDFVGEVDMSVSVASLRAGCPETCVPGFIESGKEMSGRDLYHPLVPNCVRNDITICKRSVVITGSNMSGKTTFLRTLVINSIMAQSIYTCFASEFMAPFVRQFSSIRIDDNLFQGRSYFFEEVNVIGLFIEEMQSGYQNLFLLDEVFKGTNSVERTALGKAILSYLNRGVNIVVVSTHDVELSVMLAEEYDVYHFSETIENGQLHFDHKLKPGPLKTRNAIRLLELGNFPKEIVSEARSLSSGFPPGRQPPFT